MAAALFQDLLKRNNRSGWRVESAGTVVSSVSPASDEASRVLAERGIALAGHRSRRVTFEFMEAFDLILALHEEHFQDLVNRFPDLAPRIYLLGETAGRKESVRDPIGNPLHVYRETAEQIERMLKAGMERIVGLVEAVEEPPGNEEEAG
jgi:ribose 5-phosphate isomerase B